MVNKKTKTIMIGFIVVLVLSVGSLAVFAQADDAETPDDERPALPFGRGFRGHMEDRLAYLAEALGITTDELEAAQQQAHAAQLADAVEEGLITQDQANTILAMQALKSYIDKDALLAEVLGISVEDLPRVFDRFYRADRSRGRGTPGSGLGLAISKEIVEMHGGSIRAENASGYGAVFTIMLPLESV